MKDCRYLCCCADLTTNYDIEVLNRMVRCAKDVTYRTMLSHCHEMLTWARQHGYELDRRRGLTLKNDWHVSYHKSSYGGRSCYYLQWSAIEFIWVRP